MNGLPFLFRLDIIKRVINVFFGRVIFQDLTQKLEGKEG
jgi:hypothetical protein